MIICEKVLGNLKEPEFQGCHADKVEIEWHEAYKKLHSKVTAEGTEIGIRLDDSILTRGLRDGDVLYRSGNRVIAVSVPPCEVIVIRIAPDHPKMACKVCYEIGNRHGALLWGDDELSFITPYNEPAFLLLQKLHGVSVTRKTRKLDFDRAISSTVSDHHH